MRLHRLAPFILLAVYLLMPPPEPVGDHFEINFSAPLSRWVELRLFDSASDCEAALAVYQQNPAGGLPTMLQNRTQARAAMNSAQCVSTDDPRLKQK